MVDGLLLAIGHKRQKFLYSQFPAKRWHQTARKTRLGQEAEGVREKEGQRAFIVFARFQTEESFKK